MDTESAFGPRPSADNHPIDRRLPGRVCYSLTGDNEARRSEREEPSQAGIPIVLVDRDFAQIRVIRLLADNFGVA
jgi:hypothetical protein